QQRIPCPEDRASRSRTNYRLDAELAHDPTRCEGLARIDRGLANGPVTRTESAALERVQDAKQFIRAASHAEIVNQLKLQHAIGVDNEYSAKCHMLSGNVDAIRSTHFPVVVCGQWELETSDAPLGRRRREPTLMRGQRIRINAKHVTPTAVEFLDPTADRSQF